MTFRGAAKREINRMAKPQLAPETRRPASLGLKWCEQCGQQYWVVTPESAAAIACVDTLTIYEWAYNGKIHFLEDGDEQIFICLNSL
jgi:hypothetical protein